ncbi:MAG: DUF2357 domain-containing protein [Deltaproteobacteria bacterium]|nr:DUF2357 domain-containing protein [Deltaproteobacteria bacterium]
MRQGAWFPEEGIAFAPMLVRWEEESLAELDRAPDVVRTREWEGCFVVLRPGHPRPLTPEEFEPFGEYLGPEAGRFLLRNFVGMARFRGIPIEVVNQKVAPGQFRRMFDEVCRRIPEVAFSFATPAGFAWEREGTPPAKLSYPALLYLLWILFSAPMTVEALFCLVHRDPHRRLEVDESEVSVERAAGTTPSVAALAGSPAGLGVVPPRHPLAETPLAKLLGPARGGFRFPRKIRTARTFWTYDTSENRFLKHFLTELRGAVAGFQRVFSDTPSILNGEFGPLLDEAAGLLDAMLADRFFEDVGELRAIPWSSTVLTRRDGYRELFGYFLEFFAASRIWWNPEDLRAICEAKDVATVYEYWVLFTLLDAMERLWGPPVRVTPLTVAETREARVYEGLKLVYPNGGVFEFQKRLPAYSRGSFRPDFVVTLGDRRLVLDAKYRKAAGASDFFDGEDEPFGSGTVKEDDLVKVHAYRDALLDLGVVGALAVYPGRETAVWEAAGGRARVGALALCPGADEQNAETWSRLWEQLEWLRAGA